MENTTATTTYPAKGESLIDCSASEAIEIWEREKYAEFVEREIAQLTQEIAADNDATAETVRWWDVECFERLETESFRGTARQFAEKLYANGWRVNVYKRLECSPCQNNPIQMQSGNRV